MMKNLNHLIIDMELKKLHMGTMAYGLESIDEISDLLATAFQQSRGIY